MKTQNILRPRKFVKNIFSYFTSVTFSKYLPYACFFICFVLGAKIYSLYFNKLDFGDEYDNLVIPWLMAKGYVPYRDFFSHHYPLLFFIGMPLEIFGHSKIFFRILVFVITFSSFAFFFNYLKGVYKYSIMPFILLASFGISLYGGQQFADGPIWALILISAFFIVIKNDGHAFGKSDAVFLTILFILLLLTSPIHLIALPLLIIFHLQLQYQKMHKIALNININNFKYSLILSFILLVLFATYLLFTKSLNSFIYDAYSFNINEYFLRNSKIITGVRPLDVYLYATNEIYIHFFLLFKTEGLALITFLKATKFLFLPFGLNMGYLSYVGIIFVDLYNNFFSLEMIISLFYISGIIRYLLSKRIGYVIFILLFLLPLRLRIDTNTHLSPYYLFAYWLAAFALTFSVKELIQRRRIFLNIIFCISLFILTGLFILKHWYNFDQTAFNSFPKNNKETVKLITMSDKNEKIFVFRSFSASYNYESNRLPYGYFMNYHSWYDESDRLKNIIIHDLKSYDGNYVIIDRKEWDDYVNGYISSWKDEYFSIIDERFRINSANNEDYILAKK